MVQCDPCSVLGVVVVGLCRTCVLARHCKNQGKIQAARIDCSRWAERRAVALRVLGVGVDLGSAGGSRETPLWVLACEGNDPKLTTTQPPATHRKMMHVSMKSAFSSPSLICVSERVKGSDP